MTSVVNQNSNTKTGLIPSEVIDQSRLPFKLEPVLGFSNCTGQVNMVGALSSPNWGAQTNFDISPQPALLSYIYLVFTIGPITNSGTGSFCLADDFSYSNQLCQILSGGQNIITQYDNASLAQTIMQQQERETSIALDYALARNMSLAQRSALAQNQQTIILPIPWSCDAGWNTGRLNDAYRLSSVNSNLRISYTIQSLQNLVQIVSGSPTNPQATIGIQCFYQTYLTTTDYLSRLRIDEDRILYRSYQPYYTDYSINAGSLNVTVPLNNNSGIMKKMIFFFRPAVNLSSGSTYQNNLSFLDGSILNNFQFTIAGQPLTLQQPAAFNKIWQNQIYPRRAWGANVYEVCASLEDEFSPEDEPGYANIQNSNLQLLLSFNSALTQQYTMSTVFYLLSYSQYRDGGLVVKT